MLWLDICVKLREERRLWVFENRVLSKMLESRWNEVTRGFRQLHSEARQVARLVSSG
jgi:hypothetical protein